MIMLWSQLVFRTISMTWMSERRRHVEGGPAHELWGEEIAEIGGTDAPANCKHTDTGSIDVNLHNNHSNVRYRYLVLPVYISYIIEYSVSVSYLRSILYLTIVIKLKHLAMFWDKGENALENAIRLLVTWRHLISSRLVGINCPHKSPEDHYTK